MNSSFRKWFHLGCFTGYLSNKKMTVAAECAFGFYKIEILPQPRQMVVQTPIMFTSIQWGSNFWLLFCFLFSIIINLIKLRW
jgi:hypothetical protein